MKNVLTIINKPIFNAIAGIIIYAIPFFVHVNFTIDLILLIISYAGLTYAVLTSIFYLLQEFTKYKNKKKHLLITNIASAISSLIIVILFTFPSLIPNYYAAEDGYIKENQIYVTTNKECDYCEISADSRKRAVFLYNLTHDHRIQVVDLSNETNLGTSLNTKINIFGSIAKMKNNEIKQIPYSRGTNDKKPLRTSESYIYKSIYDIKKA